MRCSLAFFVIGWALLGAGWMTADAQTPSPDDRLYYATDRQATVYAAPDSSRPYLRLQFREPVHRLGQDDNWCHIRTEDGAKGHVACSAISNVWIRVSKQDRQVYLYEGTRLVKSVRADFGYNAFADKERRGSESNRDHWRTPEGAFYVVAKNPNSKFYKALVLNYPTREDAERGLRQGLISSSEHRAIVEAHRQRQMPPMNTALGGWIEIHGDGTGGGTNWTQGCVAIRNDDIDNLWQWAEVGTPVIIE